MQSLKNERPLYKVRLPGEQRSHINEQIGRNLKTFYERCMTDELPPRLRELLKKLENEELETPEGTPKPSV